MESCWYKTADGYKCNSCGIQCHIGSMRKPMSGFCSMELLQAKERGMLKGELITTGGHDGHPLLALDFKE